jgi:hypothetical protein
VTIGCPGWPRMMRRQRPAATKLGRGDIRGNVPAPALREGMDSLSAFLGSHRREGVAIQAQQARRSLFVVRRSMLRAGGIVGPRRCPAQRYGKCCCRQPCRQTEEEIHRRTRETSTADDWQGNSVQGRASLASRAPSTSGLRGPTCNGHSATAGFVPPFRVAIPAWPVAKCGTALPEPYHTDATDERIVRHTAEQYFRQVLGIGLSRRYA